MKRIQDTVFDASPALAGAKVEWLDSNGDPITIYADNQLGGATTFALTDANGLYDVYVPDGTYTRRISYQDHVVELPDDEIFDDSDLYGRASRALVVPPGEVGPTIPAAADRIGKVLGFGVNGDPIAINQGGADAALRTDLASAGGDALIERNGVSLATALDTIETDLAAAEADIAELPVFDEDDYTPTLTNVTNLDASTAYTTYWQRQGGSVHVWGKVDVDPTSTAQYRLGVSLPVASDFANEQDCVGNVTSPAVNESGVVRADATNNRAEIVATAASTANRSVFFDFRYRII